MGAAASFGSRPARIDYLKQLPQELHDCFQPFVRTSHIYRQYLHYCYLPGILPKNTDYKPTSPYLKEDLKKLDTFTEQVRYMGKYHIETLEDLYADRNVLETELAALTNQRRKLQNKIRRATPEAKVTLREAKAGVTARITELRKRLKLNEGIEERSLKMKEKTDLLYANEYRAQEKQQKLKAALPEMQTYLETETDKTENLQRFIDKVKKLTEIKELTPELIHEFIDRIVVYAPKYLDGKRYQVVDIYYSGVGILRELIPEEMEEAFQKRLAKQAQGKEIPA